ncbi:unnamed protein product [Owenia fusiformis]|uniref:Uncharacterized protein n=1 Tax=Owenia fusiformis TaxID=6347 RepID=A0A8J1UWP9_OWEFU|nr:unnamed protein product [Owenia fusiformis]
MEETASVPHQLDENNQTVSLTHLPDICLVKILSYLDLPDRLNVARTSSILGDRSSHPSLWHKVIIQICGLNNDENDRENALNLALRNKAMIEKFGHFFKDLRLMYYGEVNHLYQVVQDVMNAITKSCRLESLTLDLDARLAEHERDTADTQEGGQITREMLYEPISNLISTLPHLRSFALKFWSIRSLVHTSNFNLLKSLSSNTQIQNLEKLDLFLGDPNSCKARNHTCELIGPRPEYMETFFQGYFKHLKHLCLRTSMLNERVLLSLTEIERAPLKFLKIMVCCAIIPKISSDVWTKLTGFCPDLEVEIFIALRRATGHWHMPFEYNSNSYLLRADFLKPEIPLVAMSYSRFTPYWRRNFSLMPEIYRNTLREFTSLSTIFDNIDAELVAMVTICHNLQHFCYHGKLKYQTAITIARLKGENWKHFELVKGQINLTDQNQHDHNGTISIEDLNREVSSALKRTWRPVEHAMSKASYRASHLDDDILKVNESSNPCALGV